ncbi:MAG: hypothetical protein ACRD21_20795 [Vicinamibacteria bacterium]
MSLKIMIAGCAKEEKDVVGASVKRAFTDRPAEEAWSVSVVKIASQWSVEINGPEAKYKGLSFVAQTGDLTASLEKALVEAGNHAKGPNRSTSSPAGPAGEEKKDRYDCEQCSARYEVVYLSAPGERQEVCPVACPQCWHVNHVPIAEGAGATGDYRAQALG